MKVVLKEMKKRRSSRNVESRLLCVKELVESVVLTVLISTFAMFNAFMDVGPFPQLLINEEALILSQHPLPTQSPRRILWNLRTRKRPIIELEFQFTSLRLPKGA